MVVNVGINGFGRVGRVIFRTCLEASDIEITAINDPALDVDYISYLIKYDSTHGRLPGNVSHTDDEIKVNDHRIKVFRQKYPVCIPWSQAEVQYVVEASGMFTSMEKALGHLASETVRRVIVTAPSANVPMIVIGVNDQKIEIEQRVISCGSSTLYCLAPIIKVLQEYYGVEAGFITSIHAMTPSLKPLDGLCLRGKHWRDHRSILQNIIPATTEACKALGKIIPQVRDKLSGLAFRVPIVNVSVLDITIRLLKPTTTDEIVRNIERVSKTTMKDIITTCKEETVSSDFMNETHSCIVDAKSSLQLEPNFFKIICWYENEYSYACRVVDLIHLSEKQFEKADANRLAQLKIKVSKVQDQQTEDSLKNVQESCRVLELETKPTNKKNIKSPLRPVLLKKPMILNHSAHSSIITASEPNKNKVELFKIWNDENIVNNSNNVRQNRGSFFQTCNKPDSGVGNTQERLEKVKEEFSKMVSITELLLKKSYSNKLSFNFDPPKENLDTVKTETGIKEPVQQKNNQKHVKLDMSDGDGKISDSTLHLGCSKKTVPHVCDKKISDLIMVETIKSLHSKNKNFLLPGKKSPIHGDSIANGDAENKTTKNSAERTSKLPNQSIAFKREMSDTFSNIIMKFHLQPTESSIRITNKDNTNAETTNERSHAVNIDVNLPVQILTTSESSVDIEKNTAPSEYAVSPDHERTKNSTETENEQRLEDVKKNQETINVYDNMKKIKNIDRIGVELKRRSIVLFHEENSNADSGKAFCEQDCMQFDEGFQEQVKVTEEKKSMHTSIPPPSFVTGTYTMNASSAVKKQDIYDKLDSPDGTESDNSLNGKKSQVIHIADLTNSLDDLKRLDKICRIIEMSDELSDKLFSPLDNYKAEGRTKRWSFKDLCDRICLDEFSDQVFGK